MPKSIVIIGSGYMAEEHIKALKPNKRCHIAGIMSRNNAKAKQLADAYGIEHVESSIEKLHQKTAADGVVVTVNELSTIDVLTDCAIFPWLILCEKPIGLFAADLRQYIKNIGEKSSHVFVAMNRRHYTSTKYVTERLCLESGRRHVEINDQENVVGALEAGQPRKVAERWMVANSIHLIDYFSVFCRGQVVDIKEVLPWSGRNPFVFHCNLLFDSDDIGSYKAVWNAPGPWSVKVTTRSTLFEMQPLEQLKIQKFPEKFGTVVDLGSIDLDIKAGLYSQGDEFLSAMEEKKHSLPDLFEYLKTHSLVESMYKTSIDLTSLDGTNV